MAALTVPVSDRDHIEGPDNAPITLVEYADFECPRSGRAYYILHRLLTEMRGKIRFVYRNLPLTQIHPYALAAALAAEAAGQQGRFWEMHDVLFEHQEAIEPEHLLAFAQVLGLDIENFIIDMTSDEMAERVRQDFMSGIRSGANRTPTLFINSKLYNQTYDYETLQASLEKIIQARSRARSGHEATQDAPVEGRFASSQF